MRKWLVMGLPGSGKTTLATGLAQLLGAIHLNADAVRANVHRDLGFSESDRVEQARRLGWWADTIVTRCDVVADFICPTPECRRAFGADVTIWLNTIVLGRYVDTNALFVPPSDAIELTRHATPGEVVELVERYGTAREHG